MEVWVDHKHCSKGAQPVLKTVYRSSCRDKHSCQRRDSNLSPLTLQSDVLTTRLLRPAAASRPTLMYYLTYTHTHTRLTALCLGVPGWAGTRKVKPIWILLKLETVSGNGIGWAICKSAPRSRQITTPAPHYSSFLQAGCPSCCPTNSVKALKAIDILLDIVHAKRHLDQFSRFCSSSLCPVHTDKQTDRPCCFMTSVAVVVLAMWANNEINKSVFSLLRRQL